jgi:23S rRNA (cytidine1920-2'-O)/16S rRNA (cytidine1409-2'-O)-methyltransferase
LDQLLVERGLFSSREKARRAVMAGVIVVDGRVVDKAGAAVNDAARVEVLADKEPFVSRGGRKLAHALDAFGVDPQGMVCLDVGASTGGFTDCLLQRGARRVYALDVGRGQLDYGLRNDPRVVVLVGINARHLKPDALAQAVDLITVDVSFISLLKVVPALLQFLTPEGVLLTLIKPQFEVGRGLVGKGGVVRDEELRQSTVSRRSEELASLGVELVGIVDSEVTGVKGNRESFALFRGRP